MKEFLGLIDCLLALIFAVDLSTNGKTLTKIGIVFYFIVAICLIITGTLLI